MDARVLKELKIRLRRYGIGRYAYATPIVAADATMESMKKYKQMLNSHTAGNVCLSAVQLVGVSDVESVVKITATGTAEGQVIEVTQLSLREVLMKMMLQDTTKPLLTGVSLNDEGNVVI